MRRKTSCKHILQTARPSICLCHQHWYFSPSARRPPFVSSFSLILSSSAQRILSRYKYVLKRFEERGPVEAGGSLVSFPSMFITNLCPLVSLYASVSDELIALHSYIGEQTSQISLSDQRTSFPQLACESRVRRVQVGFSNPQSRQAN